MPHDESNADPDAWPPRDPEIQAALQQAFASGDWGKYHGQQCDALSAALRHTHQVSFARLCCSGTMAVELALRGLKIGVGQEVVLAGYDFPGNFRAIEAVGARPVLVDLLPNSWCLDVDQIESALSADTRAILVSHLHGGVADMRSVRELADRRGVAVIEDACQNPGAIVQGKPAGAWGDVGVMSFGGSKLLTAGRGGAILTSQPEIDQRIRVYSERGNDAFPLSELQAAVLLPQLQRLAARNAQRQTAVDTIRNACAKLPYLEPVSAVDEESQAAYFKVGFRYLAEATTDGTGRDTFLAALQAQGFQFGEGFRGFVKRSARRCRVHGSLPISAAAAESTVVLHHPILLATPAKLDRLIQVLRGWGVK
ncbi:MAG TPA: perosamine synthetase [Planctomycetaceae bacterium]|nr:perosamine synthetase [Planctomycetaceae bacterium]